MFKCSLYKVLYKIVDYYYLIRYSILDETHSKTIDEIDLVPSLTIIEDAVRTPFVDGLGSLEGAESEELEVLVEKSDGELKVHIRHDDEGDRHGLFVHGFRPGSLAEGVLEIGDELLEVNGHVVKSKYLEDLVLALRDQDEGKPFVSMKVCRRDLRALAPIVSGRSVGVGGAPGEVGSSLTPGATRVMKAERPLCGDEIDLVPSLTIIEDAVRTPFVDEVQIEKEILFSGFRSAFLFIICLPNETVFYFLF